MQTERLMSSRITAWLGCLLAAAGAEAEVPGARPLPAHPGNVFLTGETVRVMLPFAGEPPAWQLVDAEGAVLREGSGGAAKLDALPVGYYEIRDTTTNRVALAVLPKQRIPVANTTPIALDLASAWNLAPANWPAAASLARLAGVAWVRDRFTWPEVEPVPRIMASHTRFDDSAAALTAAGLQVLTVNHQTPPWGGDDPGRFPTDLRDAFGFFRAAAARWRGAISAIEPWNEAEIDNFGGHLGCEIASFQKAAWLGLKAGNPQITAGQSAFAVPQRALLDDFTANEPAAYFDTFNLHHYAAPADYGRIYGDFRAAAAGRPVWTTEANWPLHWTGEVSHELSDADAHESATRVAKVFSAALHEGSRRVFWFLLPHYSEGTTQFGLLRADLTPRPAYVALAAVGHLLAEAQPLGRLNLGTNLTAFALAAKPEGNPQVVVVAWSEGETATLPLPSSPLAIYDYLGRAVAVTTNRLALTPAPQFVVLRPGTEKSWPLTPPPAPAERLKASPSAVVLQVVWPPARAVRSKSALRLADDKPETVPLFAYNFGPQRVRGTVRLEQPSPLVQGLRIGPGGPQSEISLELEPGERRPIGLVVDARRAPPDWFELPIRIEGGFGRSGRSVLSLNFAAASASVAALGKSPVPQAAEPRRWEPSASGRGRVTISATKNGGVLFEAAPRGDNRHCYPRLELDPATTLEAGVGGLEFELTPLTGEGQFHVILEERGGASYIIPLRLAPRMGRATDCVAWFDDATWGATWSSQDDNSQLDPNQIVAVRIGCNTRETKVRFAVRNLRWLRR